MNPQHARLMAAAIEYDRGDARRIQHFVKVHDLAATIGALEGLEPEVQFVLETAAILHDIGIHQAEVVHHDGHGKYQEIEGPIVAERIMRDLGGYTESEIERVKFLIGHHHTYDGVDGLDYQILLEADFLVNAYEDGLSAQGIRAFRAKVFRTRSGIRLLDAVYGLA